LTQTKPLEKDEDTRDGGEERREEDPESDGDPAQAQHRNGEDCQRGHQLKIVVEKVGEGEN